MNPSGNPIDYLFAFFGGVILSFTPCVYPLIPISASYIGIRSGGSKRRGFTLSLVYVSGIAITYSILGLLASLTGKFFGSFTAHPVTYILVGLVMIIFGLSMLGVFQLSLPSLAKPMIFRKNNYLSTLFLGLSSGLIISPCVTPVLGGILTVLFTKKDVFYGMTLLLSFAYGMGLILIIVGTFSSILIGLPKLGKWLLYIERFCAFILISVGVYYIYTAIGRI
ncbi:MAG: sulfite exporter TauE/SafE family protein [Candidatus Omnitrophica bacterium]|nr:sulfite exporter TauE/SafE family protein [Candidatus Omnitrophota bacterium]MBU1928421.1 sulfite exporter TauE/SafE family protein [Candidatus Omnitrophota bacterium]MBU2034303.1 sulfite exporter TauE/SafE family protein [Candidatus Omnitrophota bacterium]